MSAAAIGAKKGKKHIISTAFEHHAVLHTLKKLEKQGFEIELLPVECLGNITAKQVEEAIRPDTCLVTTMFANNEIGSVLPIAEIGAVCREKDVLFHTDAISDHLHGCLYVIFDIPISIARFIIYYFFCSFCKLQHFVFWIFKFIFLF